MTFSLDDFNVVPGPIVAKVTGTTATVTFGGTSSPSGNISGYVATSTPGGLTGRVSGASSRSITVSGLTSGVTYRFTVASVNSLGGTSVESDLSNEVTVGAPTRGGVPTAPTVRSVNVSGTTLSVSYDPPSYPGGTNRLDYQLICQPGAKQVSASSATSGTIVLNGLASGKQYSCWLMASNAQGSSTPTALNRFTVP